MKILVWTAVLMGPLLAPGTPPRPDPPALVVGQDPDDLKEYRKRLEKQQRDDRKRADEWAREDRKIRREAERAWDRDRDWGRGWGPPLAPVARPRLDPGWSVLRPGSVQYRSSGYQGYTPAAPGAWVAPAPGGPIGLDPGGWLAPRAATLPAPFVPYRVESRTIVDGGPPPPPLPDADLAGGPAVPPGAITDLARRLAEQADAFIVAFAPQAGRVPEGGQFLADATALRDAAAGFHDLARTGAPPEQIVLGFQAVADRWQQLEARMARVSGGRVGPNIATALEMGQTVAQIQQILPAPVGGPIGP